MEATRDFSGYLKGKSGKSKVLAPSFQALSSKLQISPHYYVVITSVSPPHGITPSKLTATIVVLGIVPHT